MAQLFQRALKFLEKHLNLPDIMKPRIKIIFDIQGFICDPSEISRILGIEADTAWKAGDPIPYWPIPKNRKFSCWRLIEESETYDAGELIKTVIRRLLSAKSNFQLLPSEAAIMVYVILNISDEGSLPGVVLDEETIRFLSETKAELDIDLQRKTGSDSLNP